MNTETLLYVILVIILLLITLIFFLKTPKEKRTLDHAFKENTKWLENRLKSYPDEAEAVIIKAQKKKAFLYILPIILLILPAFITAIYVNYIMTTPIICHQVFNINLSIFTYKIISITMVVTTYIIVFYNAYQGYKIYKNKYSPPLDSVYFKDVIAKKSKYYKVIGIFNMLLPILVLIVYIYNYDDIHNALNLCDSTDCQKKLNERVIKECKSDIIYVK